MWKERKIWIYIKTNKCDKQRNKISKKSKLIFQTYGSPSGKIFMEKRLGTPKFCWADKVKLETGARLGGHKGQKTQKKIYYLTT